MKHYDITNQQFRILLFRSRCPVVQYSENPASRIVMHFPEATRTAHESFANKVNQIMTNFLPCRIRSLYQGSISSVLHRAD